MYKHESDYRIIFGQLFNHFDRIEIPIIQRDYAQGRPANVEVREEFLRVLHDALLLSPEDSSLPLNLDFIYGSVEGTDEIQFLPLDGQQRLTTLFLLHWYLSWKDGYRDQFVDLIYSVNQRGSKFSYIVRPSSKEFFDALVNYFPNSSPSDIESIEKVIVDQPWYFRSWKLDPTIQSSLVVLDAIHARFSGTKCLYPRLVDIDQPAITFQLLELKDFGLSDDLYIKMNSRGVPLTEFENFKARFKEILQQQFDEETKSIGNQEFKIDDYFARKIDTQWANFFWRYRDKSKNLYDELVINLFRATAIITRNPKNDAETYREVISKLLRSHFKSTFSNFHAMNLFDRELSETVMLLLDNWSSVDGGFVHLLPNNCYFDENLIFKKITNDPTNLSYEEIVQFVAYVEFIRKYELNPSPCEFQEWMRIIRNLSINTTYNRPYDMQRSLTEIESLIQHSENILSYFANIDKPLAGFFEQQIIEEQIKASLILADEGWRTLIDRAEAHGYFRGQIEFLLKFSGVYDKRESSCDVVWDKCLHKFLQDKFKIYLQKAELMFNERGLVNVGNYHWQRALLSIGDYLLPARRQNHSFLQNASTETASWKRLLRGTGHPRVPKARAFLQQLWDKIDVNKDINDQLNKIIDEASNFEPWRGQLIYTSKAIEYCEKQHLRFHSDDVYLLTRSVLGGYHAELFTFCLYHNKFLEMAKQNQFEPLVLQEYYSVYGTDEKPGIIFHFEVKSCEFRIKVERFEGNYVILINRTSLESEQVSSLMNEFCETLVFEKNETKLKKVVEGENLAQNLLNISETTSQVVEGI